MDFLNNRGTGFNLPLLFFLFGALILIMFNSALDAIGIFVDKLPAGLKWSMMAGGWILFLLFGVLSWVWFYREFEGINQFIVRKSQGLRKEACILFTFIFLVALGILGAAFAIGNPQNILARILKVATGIPAFIFMVWFIIKHFTYLLSKERKSRNS